MLGNIQNAKIFFVPFPFSDYFERVFKKKKRVETKITDMMYGLVAQPTPSLLCKVNTAADVFIPALPPPVYLPSCRVKGVAKMEKVRKKKRRGEKGIRNY